MTWKNIKSFLIILFLCIDIFLLFVINSMNKSMELSNDNIKDAVELLNASDIFIDNKIIPKKSIKYSSVELMPAQTPEMFYKVSHLITTSPDNQISFTLPVKLSEPINISEIKKVFAEYGIPSKNIVIKSNGNHTYITEKEGNALILNNIMRITTNENSTTFTGRWYEYQLSRNLSSRHTGDAYATSALISLINETAGKKENITISDIDFGYYSMMDISNSKAKSISAFPCYTITTNTGKTYYFNVLENSFVKL